MQEHLPFSKVGVSLKDVSGCIFAIVNVVVWYSHACVILRDIINNAYFIYFEFLAIYIALFLSAIISILAGASLVSKTVNQKHFLLIWNLIGVFVSLALMMVEKGIILNLLFLSFLIGASFGLGLPICMAIFADVTTEENRARFGSITILSIFLGLYASGFVMSANLFLNSLILAVWRFCGLLSIPILWIRLEGKESEKNPSFSSLFKDQTLLLYLIPWSIFSIVNYLAWPICSKIQGDFIYFSAIISNFVAGIFAIIAGFAADKIGRKRTLLAGFIIFGIGYAILGINPFNIYGWYFYMFVDGIAWGIFFVIFWFTIWGDLAREKSSEKYYALGILPYSLSGFLRVTVGPWIANTISEYAIFSFAALFLFLAVVPLMFASETLPERTLKERELRGYVEKAKRVREKFT